MTNLPKLEEWEAELKKDGKIENMEMKVSETKEERR